jgi:hypothetical protein
VQTAYRKVDIQIQDQHSGYWKTVLGGDFPEQGISQVVANHKRTHPNCRVRAIDRVTKALIDLQ